MASTLTIMKTYAKTLRSALAKQNIQVSHSQALELIAQQHGKSDWNTFCAYLSAQRIIPFQLNQTVKGVYRSHPFSGKIVSLSMLKNHYKLSISFDKPINVIDSKKLSNIRRRITMIVDQHGQSIAKSSTGVPQLRVDLI